MALHYITLHFIATKRATRPDSKDRFGLSRGVISLNMGVGSCIPYVQTGGVGGGHGE